MTVKKKICFVSPYAASLFFPKRCNVIGGSEVQIYQIAKALSQQEGFRVSVITADVGEPDQKIEKIRVMKSYPVGAMSPWVKLFAVLLAPMKLWWAMARSGADIFVQRGASAETGLIAFFTICARRRFIYMAAHERDCDGTFARQNGLRGKLFHWGLRHAHQIIVQHADQQQLLKLHEKIEAIIFPTVYAVPDSPSARDQRSHIFWQGRLVDWKQPEVFLRVVEAFPNVPFTMVGQARNKEQEKILSEIKKYPNVKYFSYVPFEEIDRLFQTARLFVSTSRFEGFPNTFIQATMHGVPLLSLNVDPEGFIEKNHCGWNARGDEAKLKFFLQQFLNDPAMEERMSKAAHRYAKTHHDVVVQIKKMVEILKEL